MWRVRVFRSVPVVLAGVLALNVAAMVGAQAGSVSCGATAYVPQFGFDATNTTGMVEVHGKEACTVVPSSESGLVNVRVTLQRQGILIFWHNLAVIADAQPFEEGQGTAEAQMEWSCASDTTYTYRNVADGNGADENANRDEDTDTSGSSRWACPAVRSTSPR